MSVETIVVIEEGTAIADMLEKELMKPHQILTFLEANEATYQAIQARYDDLKEYVALIIVQETELLDGIAVFRQLAQRLYFPNVLIVTNDRDLERSIVAMKEGCVDYLIAPGMETLKAHVEDICKKSIHKISDHYDKFEVQNELVYKRTLTREVELKTYIDENRVLTQEERSAIRYASGPEVGKTWESVIDDIELSSTRKPHVLIVDDEEMQRESLAEYLCDDYETVMVGSSEAALAYMAEHSIDVALLDIRMEGMPGDELLRQIRQISPLISVIMVTAYPDTATAVQTLGDGAVEFLNKQSYTEEALLAAVKRAAEMKYYRDHYICQDLLFERRLKLWKKYYMGGCHKAQILLRDFYVFFPEFWVESVDKQLPIKPDYVLGDLDEFVEKMRAVYEKEEARVEEKVMQENAL